MNKDHILDEIRRTAEENNGQPLGIARFKAETGITRNDWFGKYWAKWGDALIEAGYQPNTLRGAYDDDWIIEKLVGLIQELGDYPVGGEIRLKSRNTESFPHHNVFTRLGRKVELAAKVINWCEAHDGYDDIIAICIPIAKPSDEIELETENATEGDLEDGYVYLIKSGKHFKVGRTNSLGRREYELKIQLPEKATTVHSIKTDDTKGIEVYWHKRFSDRRLNGEWFALTPADIRAFKRRKFM